MKTIDYISGDCPTYALSYLINGDSSGMEDSDIAACDAWFNACQSRLQAQYPGATIQFLTDDVEGAVNEFDSNPAFGLASATIPCAFAVWVSNDDPRDAMPLPWEPEVPDSFVDAYVECSLWSSTYETEEREDNPMDDGEHELADETREAMAKDCQAFFNYCRSLELNPVPEYGGDSYSDEAMSGHDLWLTRNGHGAGYFDRGLGEIGDKLSDAAKTMGGRDLYVGDDGLIYQS